MEASQTDSPADAQADATQPDGQPRPSGRRRPAQATPAAPRERHVLHYFEGPGGELVVRRVAALVDGDSATLDDGTQLRAGTPGEGRHGTFFVD